jgi:spore cortex biosynthesis protein YabQ
VYREVILKLGISVGSQAYVFLYSILGGIIIAFIYDIFRIKRKRVRTRSILLHVEDFLYWMIAAIVMFATVYYSNEGEIRGYIFFGTALGVIFYVLVFSRIIMKISLTIIDFIVKTVVIIWRIITYPFKIIFKILAVPTRFLFKLFKRFFRGAKKASKHGTTKMALWGKAIRRRRKKI